MKIGMIYAMAGEIESLLSEQNAQPLQTVAGVPFYQIRENVIACAGGVAFLPPLVHYIPKNEALHKVLYNS